jgi:heptosyltransferase II
MNVLIIKTGHTETFDVHIKASHIVSLGDVLRSTVLLHLFKNDNVTWLTSTEARALLEHNTFIDHLETKTERITPNFYDLVINLEKTGIPDGVKGKVFTGFDANGVLLTTFGTFDCETWLKSPEVIHMNWSQKLFFLFGKVWNGEGYILFPREKIEIHPFSEREN